jgi:glycosyltransferase involved in cell wall biosynthesis
MPKISVIIPCYQHGDTIARCLNSVFGQTLKDVEVIVINDGSTDDTDVKIKPYLGRIIYEKTVNSGAQKARNRGFALSKGEYVIFLDADIEMKPTMLEELYDALLNDEDASYAYCGFRFGIARFKPFAFDAKRLRKMNYIHTSALIRRSDFPGFDPSLKRFQDWDLWLTMLAGGKRGVPVRRCLFSAKPRSKFGMSQWRPKIFFSALFEALGIRPKSVRSYQAAAAAIAQKHGLEHSRDEEPNGRLWIAFLAVFTLSALGFAYPWVSGAAFLVIVAATVAATRTRLLHGTAIMLSELIFGSLAGKTLAISIAGFALPLRYAIFAVVGMFWITRIAQGRVRLPPKNLAIGVGLTLAAAVWGLINGIYHGIPLREALFDANAYFALPLILFFASAAGNRNDQRALVHALKHGAIALSVVTLGALYFFGHRFPDQSGVFAYKWLRDSRIAEITALDGGIYRVFMQSQIFCVAAFLRATVKEKSGGWRQWIWGIFPAAALLVSGSRSFAVGIAAALAIAAAMIFADRAFGPRYFARAAMRLGVFLACAAAIYAVILAFPLPAARNQASFQDMLRSRSVSDRDAATASRWKLLPKLNEKIMQSPFFGNGFGTTVTYQSFDQRIVSTTGGMYTTSAFEWNYHDILVKMGLLGLAAYGFLLWSIFRILLNADYRHRIWLIPAFFGLLITNALSPYLNHPLGIGFLGLLVALSERQPERPAAAEAIERVRAPAPAAVPSGAMLSRE